MSAETAQRLLGPHALYFGILCLAVALVVSQWAARRAVLLKYGYPPPRKATVRGAAVTIGIWSLFQLAIWLVL